MNDLLRDMIEAGDIAVFIDDMMVGTETEEGYNNIVEEVLRRIVENNLFVELEKCVWKVREIGFLKVVIGPDGKRKGSRDSELAGTKKCEGCAEVFEVSKLL